MASSIPPVCAISVRIPSSVIERPRVLSCQTPIRRAQSRHSVMRPAATRSWPRGSVVCHHRSGPLKLAECASLAITPRSPPSNNTILTTTGLRDVLDFVCLLSKKRMKICQGVNELHVAFNTPPADATISAYQNCITVTSVRVYLSLPTNDAFGQRSCPSHNQRIACTPSRLVLPMSLPTSHQTLSNLHPSPFHTSQPKLPPRRGTPTTAQQPIMPHRTLLML